MNNVILMGRLARDPESRYSQGENSMCITRYTLAVDRRQSRNAQNGQQTADFIRCVAFGSRGEFAAKYFHKGMRVLVSGSISTGSYQNKEGKTVYTTDILIDSQEFADGKESGTSNRVSTSQAQNNFVSPGPADTFGDGFMSIPDGVEDEGLPFN